MPIHAEHLAATPRNPHRCSLRMLPCGGPACRVRGYAPSDECRCHCKVPACRVRGFTLVEVLVALVIVALVLGAGLRAAGALTAGQQRLAQKAYAGWSADNRLAELRLAGIFPAPGRNESPCPQAQMLLICVEEVRPTVNPSIRLVNILVYPADDRNALLLRRSAFIADLPPFAAAPPS